MAIFLSEFTLRKVARILDKATNNTLKLLYCRNNWCVSLKDNSKGYVVDSRRCFSVQIGQVLCSDLKETPNRCSIPRMFFFVLRSIAQSTISFWKQITTTFWEQQITYSNQIETLANHACFMLCLYMLAPWLVPHPFKAI